MGLFSFNVTEMRQNMQMQWQKVAVLSRSARLLDLKKLFYDEKTPCIKRKLFQWEAGTSILAYAPNEDTGISLV